MNDGKQNDDDVVQPDAEPGIIEAEVIKEETIPNNEAQAPAPRAKPSTKWGWISTTVLAAFIGGVYAAPYFKDGLSTLGLLPASPPVLQESSVNLAPLQKNIQDLEAQLLRHREILAQHEEQIASSSQNTTQLTDQVSRLATTPAGATTQPSAEIVALKETVSRLTNDIARLANLSSGDNPAVEQLTGSIALLRAESEQIQARFSALETALSDLQAGSIDASPRGRLLLSLSRIKERAMKGFAFTSDIEALRPDIAALSALDQQLLGAELAVLQEASAGVSTYERLVQDFDRMAAAALQSAQKEEGGFLSSLFTVRRTDAAATGNDAIFLVAERQLALRDLTGAISELEKLTGAALAASEAWRSNARKLTRVESAFDRTITTITQASAPAGDAQ